jgi:hypothetical protein|tara:strand:- start:5232 stop:5444 length:213 start_codon:yes stop_codon:yes gene_type:complete
VKKPAAKETLTIVIIAKECHTNQKSINTTYKITIMKYYSWREIYVLAIIGILYQAYFKRLQNFKVIGSAS